MDESKWKELELKIFNNLKESRVLSCGVVEKECEKYPDVKSFRKQLVEIYEKRKQDLRLTDDYRRIESQIKQACEKAAYDGRNCVYIMDLHLENYINYSYYIRDNGRYLEKTVEQICEDLDLDIQEGYITWKNSL